MRYTSQIADTGAGKTPTSIVRSFRTHCLYFVEESNSLRRPTPEQPRFLVPILYATLSVDDIIRETCGRIKWPQQNSGSKCFRGPKHCSTRLKRPSIWLRPTQNIAAKRQPSAKLHV